MYIQVISDIHLEFLTKLPKITPKADILLLCGDIGYPKANGKGIYWQFIGEMSKLFKKVLLISGNHCYYMRKSRVMNPSISSYDLLTNKPKYRDSLNISEIEEIIRKYVIRYPNVSYLQRNAEIYEGIRFLGCTLWTAVSQKYFVQMNDSDSIFYEDSLLTATDVNTMHLKNVKWLEEEIANSTEPIIILTHHLPSFQLITLNSTKGLFSNRSKEVMNHTGYATDLEHLFTNKVLLWAFGHSHQHIDMNLSNIRFISNPRGYKGESLKYKDTAYEIKIN